MQNMQQGGNAPISVSCPMVRFRWSGAEGRGVEADVSAYLLTASGKVRDDGDMIFYNQPVGAGGAIRFDPADQGSFKLDLPALPDVIQKIAFCLTIDEAHSKSHTLALLEGAEVVLADGNTPALSFRPWLAEATEAAMILAEAYRRDGQWKFRAVGQGFNGGLAPLARSFGIDVADEPIEPSPPAAARHFERVSLDEADDAVALVPGEKGFGELLATLNWSRGRRRQEQNEGIDLDLCCLIEMNDGRKGAVQAIGNMLGAFDVPPFVLLCGDDRSGGDGAGEALRINGEHWEAIRRILVFINVYDGVPDWQLAAPSLLLMMPEQPSIDIRIDAGRNDRRICAIALLENDRGKLTAMRKVEYFADQQELDERFGWGLRWQAGTKT